MKCFLRFTAIILLSAGVVAIIPFCKKKPTIPTVTTLNVSGITQTTAASGGKVTNDGGAEVTDRGVCWGTNQNPTTSFNKTTDGNGSGPFTSNLTGLNPGETYHLRAYATNSEGTGYGNEILFNTNPVLLATLTTDTASSITSSSAISGGKIINDGGGSVIARGVCWSMLPNPTTADNKTTDGSGSGSFTSNLSGLLPGILYHIRAYVTNSAGTAYGDDLAFTTIALTPTVTTSSVTAITQTSATLGGDVTATGGADVTAKGVCWGTSANPTIADSHISAGTGLGSFTSSLTGLIPGSTYYVRAYGTNNIGTSYGNEVSFTTNPVTVPELTTSMVSSITYYSVVSGGNIISDGGLNVTTKGLCWNTMGNPTILDNYSIAGTGSRSFISSIRSLSPGTTYYIRAYATNEFGTGYGNQIMFMTILMETKPPESITLTSALCGGYIPAEGGSSVIARGVCWGTSSSPTLDNNSTIDGSGIGDFKSNITGLTPNTTYYIRAYATNSTGTYYGNELFLKTYTSTVTDIDGNVYYTVTIGSQIWMAENLKTTRYANGDSIINGPTSYNPDISNELEPKYQWDNLRFGRFFTWYAAADNRNACPSGWHLPSDTEWTILTDYLGGESVAGSKMRTTSSWMYDNDGIRGTNESGFTALPGGQIRLVDGDRNAVYTNGNWWSSTISSNSKAWIRRLYSSYPSIGRSEQDCGWGYSVRCLKDN